MNKRNIWTIFNLSNYFCYTFIKHSPIMLMLITGHSYVPIYNFLYVTTHMQPNISVQTSTVFNFHKSLPACIKFSHLSSLYGLAHRLKLAGTVSAGHADWVCSRGDGRWHSQGGFQLLDQLGLGLTRPSVNPVLAVFRTVAAACVHLCNNSSPCDSTIHTTESKAEQKSISQIIFLYK